jgi:methyl-accepting chemotaxis protein
MAGRLASLLAWRRPGSNGGRAFLRYHGVWAPGVRLLQNLRFRTKALLLVVCLMLPLGHLLYKDWSRNHAALEGSQRALAGVRGYELAVDEQAALGALAMAMFAEERAAEAGALLVAPAKQEAEQYALLVAAVAADAHPSDMLRQAMASVHAARTEALRLMNDRTASAAGEAPPRLEALARAERAVEVLRQAMLAALSDGAQDSNQLSGLINGGLGHLPALLREIRHATRIGGRVYRDDTRAAHGMRLMERSAAMQWMLDDTMRELEPVLARGTLPAADARKTLDRLVAFSRTVRQVARASGRAARAEDLVSATGISQERYAAMANEAGQAGLALHKMVLTKVNELLQDNERKRRHDNDLALLLTGLSVGLMAYLLVCMNKVVGGGLKELCVRVDALARGDLTERPVARGTDEVGQALTALAASVHHMGALFEAVTQGVAAVSHASREVAIGNAGLKGRTEDIRGAIGDVSERARASMEAMNRCGSEVERIAEHMRDVRADAHRSRKAMGELSQRMRGLQGKSREIGRVVLLVEAVAYQTRLLSLNASVEAARAGAAGKGFSVVAQEVRELARRSEAAARKIGEIVQSSVDDIDEGGMLTDRVGDSVRKTDERVSEVSAIMGDIVRLTQTGREQSHEVVGITRSVEESAGGNARMVEQLAHASADLRVQGDNLKRSMQHFVFG